MSKFTKVDAENINCCDNTAMFLLDNGKTQFAIHLEIMLKCIKFAEDQGKIPPLPPEWWTIIYRDFNNI